METRVALKKIFVQPRSVFVELKSERKWVPAVVFMAVLLGVHGFVTAIGTYSQNPVGNLIENKTPIEFAAQDSPKSTSDVGDDNDPSSQVTEVPRTDIRFTAIQIGEIVFVMFMLVVLIPVAYGLLCVMFFVEAVYFRIVGALLNIEIKLGDWFSFCAWSRAPAIALSVVAVIVGLFSLGRQPDSDDLEILRLTRWVDLPELRRGGENWSSTTNFDHLDANLIWVIAIQTIGFQEWSGKSALFSFAIAVIPTLIIVLAAFVIVTLV